MKDLKEQNKLLMECLDEAMELVDDVKSSFGLFTNQRFCELKAKFRLLKESENKIKFRLDKK